MRSKFGCTATLVIGALVLAVGALAFGLVGMSTIALVDTFSLALTNLALIGLVAMGAIGLGASFILRNTQIKQLLINGLSRKFQLTVTPPAIEQPPTLSLPAPQPHLKRNVIYKTSRRIIHVPKDF